MSDTSAKPRRQFYFLVKQPGAADRILILDTQELTIGRSNDSDLQAKYEDVSRRHAMLQRDGQKYSVQNLSTSSGTNVNGSAVTLHSLSNQDVIRISELEITFVESTENPATVGPKLEYASQLKDFALAGTQSDNPEATILGTPLSDEGGDEAEFEVRPAGEFGYGQDTGAEELPEPRDLDSELDGFGLHEMPAPVEMTPEALAPAVKPVSKKPSARAGKPAKTDAAWSLDELETVPETSPPTLSLNLEIEGLTPDLHKAVSSLLGKIISLPTLKIRLKSDDWG
jgi:pSer/pThr/pTyr-binding forkhead associated (FHA) protein